MLREDGGHAPRLGGVRGVHRHEGVPALRRLQVLLLRLALVAGEEPLDPLGERALLTESVADGQHLVRGEDADRVGGAAALPERPRRLLRFLRAVEDADDVPGGGVAAGVVSERPRKALGHRAPLLVTARGPHPKRGS